VTRYVRATILSIGVAVTISIAALTQPAPSTLAQTPASPSASPAVPAATPAAAPAAASPAASPTPMPRTGGFPIDLAWPLLAGGAAAVGAGAFLIRRGRR
jgi:hypothetical protein